MPYRRHRYAVSSRLGVDEGYLWPDALTKDQVTAASASEVLAVYPHRSEVPRDAWRRLFESADAEIGVLVYAGLFLAEDAGLHRIIRKKAKAGARVRFLVGDQHDPHIAERGEQEGVGDAMAAKIRNALVLYGPLGEVEGVEFRMHRTVLYNSIYRADDQVLVNSHVYGVQRIRTRRCGTCARWPVASSRASISRASNESGTPPYRYRRTDVTTN